MKRLRLVCLSLLILFALTANAYAGDMGCPPAPDEDNGEILTPPSDGGETLTPPGVARLIASILGF